MDLIDTHCHLNFKAFTKDFLEVAKRAQNAGIKSAIIPGSDRDTSKRAIEVAREINKSLGVSFAFAAVGIHPVKLSPAATPNGASPIHFDRGELDEICRLAEDESVVAIGECGLDRFHESNENAISAQKDLFIKQIDLALKLDKPLIVHNRQADNDVLGILNSFSKLPKMVFHCFSSDWKFAQKVLELGAYISFTGNITYGNPTSPFAKATGDKSPRLRGAGSNLKVIERVPLDRVMIETDAPYLVPEPLRSQGITRNEPRYVIEIAKKIAEVRGEDLKKVIDQLFKNSKNFFLFR